ncbi:FliM/FliN family flagellar motor switch protein [Massilia sp. NR 4-1]|uniref:FliM/FliN family flagellar motor switch protein n=1 Tax=Massilia sp. NR 4-1 TaxID=1678028 RepID=UPI00067E1C3A|nr:FliM/FliN family flagellar motor switch protein [Massilia sp. NR 4-1]
MHRLPVFAGQLREDLVQAMRLAMNRRYWGSMQVSDVAFSRLDGSEAARRWLNFSAPAGNLSFAIERKVLLSILNYRYGRGKGADTVPDEGQVRVTATEERLAVVLGQQLAGTLAGRIEVNLPPSDKPAAEEIKPLPSVQPPRGSWIITVTVSVSEAASGLSGSVWFALDKTMMSDVLRGLLPERESKRGGKSAAPLASRLQVGLNGRLVNKEITLGALFDLSVGDVIPVSLHRADVLLEDSRLFTAAVTEHKGKLCLTSFEDIE